MPPRIRVLVFLEYGWRNGGENSWLSIAEQLHKQHCEFIVACPSETEFSDRAEELEIECRHWSVLNDEGIRKSQEEIREEISELVNQASPDLVHGNSLSTSRLIGPVAKQMRVPSVGHLRDIVKLSRKATQDVNDCDAIIAVSDATRQFHVSQGFNASKCHVIHNGVDLERFRPGQPIGSVHQEFKLEQDCRILLCVGQIGMRKGTDTVVKCFRQIHGQIKNTALMIVGIRNSQKDEAIQFERECHSLAEDSPIFWLNRRTDIPNLMRESALLIHAARQEPLGRVLLESLASGLPFVATRVGGTAEITAGMDESVILCDPNSEATMAEMACNLLLNDKLYQKISRDFRLAAEQRFDVKNSSHHTLNLYRDIVKSARAI